MSGSSRRAGSLRDAIRGAVGGFCGAVTAGLTNGPAPVRRAMAAALGAIDDRRWIVTPRGRFTLRVGNPIERWRSETLLTKEPETIDWLDRTLGPDSVIYDVGANIGLYTLYACHLQPGIRAACFEPEALNFARLNQNIHDNGLSNRVIAFPLALGERPEISVLRLSQLESGRALHGEFHVGAEAAVHRQGMTVARLDDLPAANLAGGEPTHLKIDVDGPEIAVLRGAEKALRVPSLRHVLVELTPDTRAEALGILSDAGFHLTTTGVPAGDGTANHIFARTTT